LPAHSYQLPWSFVLIPSQFVHPFVDRFPSLSNSRRANSTVLRKRTFFPQRADPHPIFTFLEYHSVSRMHAQPPPHLPRYRDLPFARHLRLFPNSLFLHRLCHEPAPIPYFTIFLLDSLL